MKEMTNDELPEGWLSCSLGDVVDYGKTEKAEPTEIEENAWILELEDIEKDTSKLLERRTFAERQSKSTKNRFELGDVLYGKLRPYLNKVIIADQPGYCTTEIIPLKPNAALEGRFLFSWLKHPVFLDYVSNVSHGLNMPRLGTDAGKAAPFILAPLAEQKRIADKLEAVLGRVDACRTRLDRLPDLLKRFRQSVLAAATSGQLTEDWREENGGENWQKKKLTELGELGRGKSKHRPRNDPRLYGGPYPFIQTGDVANSGGVIKSNSQSYSEFGLAQSKLWPVGTVCITIAANIADTAILSYTACFPDSIVGFVANPKECLREFIKWTVDVIKDDLETYAPATAQKNINLGILYEVDLLIPPLAEQQEIVRRVEALFAFADRIEARLSTAQKTVERLTPAVLAKAFCGQLVPQDPNDEPASALLARLPDQPAAPRLRQRGTVSSAAPEPARAPAEAPKTSHRVEPKTAALPLPPKPLSPPKKAAEPPTPVGDLDRNELMALLREVLTTHGPCDRTTAIQQTAYALNYQRAGSAVATEIDNAIRAAVRRCVLLNEGSELRVNRASIAEMEEDDREFMKEQFLAAISQEGRVWIEREDAARLYAQWFGFRRTGSQIQDRVKSLINGLLRTQRLEASGTCIRRL